MDTSVKKVFLICIVQGVPENNFNVNLLIDLIKLDEVRKIVCVDLKMANILGGIGPHSSFFPCTFCEASKNSLSEPGKLRTFGSIRKHNTNWKETGANQKQLKNFFSCAYLPILKEPDDELVINIIVPPELHLMLGVVNKLYELLLQVFPEAAIEWAKQCSVEKNSNFASGFNGNNCKTLLNNTNKLENIFKSNNNFSTDVKENFLLSFKSLNELVKSCFISRL